MRSIATLFFEVFTCIQDCALWGGYIFASFIFMFIPIGDRRKVRMVIWWSGLMDWSKLRALLEGEA